LQQGCKSAVHSSRETLAAAQTSGDELSSVHMNDNVYACGTLFLRQSAAEMLNTNKPSKLQKCLAGKSTKMRNMKFKYLPIYLDKK
jgi:hypothetical protein